jgi:S-adenosylmethionine:tRNA ribosyltransferase-isomerase
MEIPTPGKNLRIADYSYTLPEDKIAFHPLPERDASRLLIYRDGVIHEDQYKNIAEYLPEGSLMVFNNTRVVNARIRFQKPTGGVIEVFCLEPATMEMSQAMQVENNISINCFIGGASKWKPDVVLQKKIDVHGKEILLEATLNEKTETHFVVTLAWNEPGVLFASVLQAAGDVPLPPYIKRITGANDTERYQTVYALHEGSVAAPTAGLHFTPGVMASLEQKNIHRSFVTLHVGAGTFQPVKTAFANEHQMHGEWMHIPKSTIETLLTYSEKTIVATGTTTLRSLESIYWLGVQLVSGKQPGDVMSIGQWEVYHSRQDVPLRTALEYLLKHIETTQTESLTAITQLMIVPGYRLRVAGALVTNFHQPQSTLLLLVAAVAGENWRAAYDYALRNDFRFLSYGDGCLFFVNND